MNRISAVIMLLLITLYVALPCQTSASAEEYFWARITKDDVNLYADENCDKLMFTLEKSYYVKITKTLDLVYRVNVMLQNDEEFPTIDGYVRKIEATPVDAAPLDPIYPAVRLTVTTDSAHLKLSPVPSAENVIVATNCKQLSYYGRLNYYGKTWYYVYFSDKFGYVEASKTSKPAIELHPTPLENPKPVIKPQQPNDDTNEPVEEPSGKMPAAEIILIVFVVLLAGGLTLAVFLPDKGKRADVFEQDI